MRKVGREVKKKKKNHRPLPKAETEFQTFSPEVGWSEWPLPGGGGPGGGREEAAGRGQEAQPRAGRGTGRSGAGAEPEGPNRWRERPAAGEAPLRVSLWDMKPSGAPVVAE